MTAFTPGQRVRSTVNPARVGTVIQTREAGVNGSRIQWQADDATPDEDGVLTRWASPRALEPLTETSAYHLVGIHQDGTPTYIGWRETEVQADIALAFYEEHRVAVTKATEHGPLAAVLVLDDDGFSVGQRDYVDPVPRFTYKAARAVAHL